MKIQLRQVQLVDVTVGGKSVGKFEVVSEWEGLLKLERVGGHVGRLVIKKPPKPGNKFEVVPYLWGGNPDKESAVLDLEVISHFGIEELEESKKS